MSETMERRVYLAQLCRVLGQRYPGRGDLPTYKGLYKKVLDGRLPEIEFDGGRYFIAEEKIPALAGRLGLA